MTTPTQTKEDRGALAKESTAALNTETLRKETDMHNHTDTISIGTRIMHRGTGELGTILGSIPDDIGILLTVAWDNPEALELPHALHTMNVDVVSGIEAVHDDDLIAECHRRGLPGTVTELWQEAERQGIKPSELLERLQGSYNEVLPK